MYALCAHPALVMIRVGKRFLGVSCTLISSTHKPQQHSQHLKTSQDERIPPLETHHTLLIWPLAWASDTPQAPAASGSGHRLWQTYH